ncbi:MAG: hypothetical protein HY547_10035 [Elusimicrobia bacterium]|nr:hypothetical protein [Elusimicrobiota bacterium]
MAVELLSSIIPMASAIYGAVVLLPVVFYFLPFVALFLFLNAGPMSATTVQYPACAQNVESPSNREEGFFSLEKLAPAPLSNVSPGEASPAAVFLGISLDSFWPPVFSGFLTSRRSVRVSPAMLKIIAGRAPPGEAIQ